MSARESNRFVLIDAAKLIVLMIGVVLGVGQVVAGCYAPNGPSSGCSDCPSTSYWDSGVDRCRNPDNGQFVKSCCCGH